MDYIKLIEETWGNLQDSLENGNFDPQYEADIQDFLYDRLLERLGTGEGLVSAFHPHGKNQTDLAVHNKLFIENKFILRSKKRSKKRWELRTSIVKEDIEKLGALKKERPTIIGVLAIVAASYNKEKDESWYTAVNESCEEKGIIMLRAWKS